MFRHVLLPVDGSSLSVKAARKGIALALSMGARVTFVFVALPYHLVTASGAFGGGQTLLQSRYEREITACAHRILGRAQRLANAAAVASSGVHISAMTPDEGIIKAARAGGCDLIAMASHGHGGLKGLLLGSVTSKVLSHTKLPVLVYR